jgi:hypothetical protein
MATLIYDVNDLQNIELDLTADYELANDIDASGFAFVPITDFEGTLDGKGYKVDGLTITINAGGEQEGAFILANSGIIRNLGLTSVSINITSTDDNAYAGAIVVINEGTIEKCSVSGTIVVTGESAYAGGFVCENYDTGIISESYSTATITITATMNDAAAGGFCYANDTYEGGAISRISNCYARGSVTASGDPTYIGGFAQYNNTTIENCYSTGAVSGTAEGGFLQDDHGDVTACYWDTITSGTAISDGGTGKTTAEMKTKSTFSGWNFSSIWSITAFCNNGYPCLQNVTPNCALIPSIQGEQVKEIITLEAMRNIEMSCMGRLYVDEEGNLTYESRYARNP